MAKTCYIVRMPATAEVGSYSTTSCKPRKDVPKDALWDYNSARRHDGLPPVRRLPAGTKITRKA